MAIALPANHPLRIELNDEVHARPPAALAVPCRISYLALATNGTSRKAQRSEIAELCRRHGIEPLAENANHLAADFGAFRLQWERHTEFARYMVIVDGAGSAPFVETAISRLPPDWLAGLTGQTLVATHVEVMPAPAKEPDADQLSRDYFGGNIVIGAPVSDGAGFAATDFRIHGDGFGRAIVQVGRMTPRQIGRTVQRLLEIDSYRMMALLALPIARGLSPFMADCERELADVTTEIAKSNTADEPKLLDRLTRLEAAIQSRHADHHFRFSAAAAYYELVERRIAELREGRLDGLQTLREFTQRRLVPAVNTCQSVARQLDALSERVGRATEALATRTAITREQQNQALLETMARRAKMQLRLQQTVEGLSLAAISYYVVGLVGYAAKGVKAAGAVINPDLVVAVSIPIVVGVLAYGLKRIRGKLKLGGET